jgi:hypothetical protein
MEISMTDLIALVAASQLAGAVRDYYRAREDTMTTRDTFKRTVSYRQGYPTPDRGLSIQRARKASEKAPQGLAKNDQGEIINRR